MKATNILLLHIVIRLVKLKVNSYALFLVKLLRIFFAGTLNVSMVILENKLLIES